MKIIIGVIGVIIIVLLAVSFFNVDQQYQDAANTPPDEQFEKLPAFSLKDYDGNTIRSSDFFGKPLVVNSWAAWCPFCKKELPDFVTVQKEFADQVVFIAIDRAEPLSVAKQYSDELGVTDDLVFLLDPSDSFYRSIGGFSMPETIFVDADGNIRDHKRGPMSVPEIRQRVEKLLTL